MMNKYILRLKLVNTPQIVSHTLNYGLLVLKKRKISKSGQDLISKMLVKDPVKRMTAEDALKHKWFKEKNQKDNESGLIEAS